MMRERRVRLCVIVVVVSNGDGDGESEEWLKNVWIQIAMHMMRGKCTEQRVVRGERSCEKAMGKREEKESSERDKEEKGEKVKKNEK